MTYGYDVANRMVSNGAVHNPKNQRVFDGTYFYFYGVAGELIGKYQPNWGFIITVGGVNYTPVTLQDHQPNLYFGGRAIRLQGHGGWVMTDRLGSVRVNGNGQRMNYYPYGAEVGTETGEGRVKFGTYTRDSAGVDYADQRYYGAGMGRFLTADPYKASAGPSDPGSWNQYAYVGGDPINFRDRSGLFAEAGDEGDGPGPDQGPTVAGGVPRPTKGIPMDPTGNFPDCNPKNNGTTAKKLNFISKNYAGAASEAASVQKDMGTTINTSALTVMFLQWGYWESGQGINPRNLAQNNFFGAQQGANGSIPCSNSVIAITGPSTNACFPGTVDFGAELSLALAGVPHTTGNPNGGANSYEDFLESALGSVPNNPAAWLQSIANAGWNGGKTYGSDITSGIIGFPGLINCLGLH
jgi:RHS repeat-associated protein